MFQWKPTLHTFQIYKWKLNWRQLNGANFWFEWQWFSWKIMKLSKNTFLAPFPSEMILAPFWRQKWKFRPIFDLGQTGFALIPRIAISNREFPNFRFRSWHVVEFTSKLLNSEHHRFESFQSVFESQIVSYTREECLFQTKTFGKI